MGLLAYGDTGWGDELFFATLMTIAVAAAAIFIGFFLAAIFASFKLSKIRILNLIGSFYTTVFRGVPELLVIYLFFFGSSGAVMYVAKIFGYDANLKIIPFRGEYYTLKKEKEYLVKGLIYPVPNPELPFLGVHFTQTMKGFVEAGPNAVLATKREGYRKRDFSLKDSFETFTYKGFWKLLKKDWQTGLWEINRSLRKSVFLKSLRLLIPEIEKNDLQAGGSGVRAQAVAPDGSLIDDFRIESSENAIHVINAPSPGATSSLVIGKHISKMALKELNL